MTARWTAPPRRCPWYTSLARLLAVCCDACFTACACFVACCCGGAQAGGEGGQRAHALRTTALPSSTLHRLCLLAVCCGACFAACACSIACCHCMTAGWGETEVPMDVSSRRLALVLRRHLAERGLLSFLSLLGAFRLHVIKRNRTCGLHHND